jgi:hypothetical protein
MSLQPSQIQYNSLDIDINRVRSSRRSMYEGAYYLYTRHIIHFTGVYNPAATAFKMGLEEPIAGNFPNDQILPAETDWVIRNWLMQPRKLLIYVVGQNVVLQSPWADPENEDITTDDNNGPQPLYCDVTSVHGQKSFNVEMVIQTDINEDRLFPRRIGDQVIDDANLQRIILANVFEQEDRLDQHFFLSRVTRGTAVFNTGVLEGIDQGFYTVAGNKTRGDPDLWRSTLAKLIPVPDNCQREDIEVSIDGANNRIRYNFADRERAFNLITANYPNIVDVKVSQTRFTENPDEWDVFKSVTMHQLIGAVAGAYLGSAGADFAVGGTTAKGVGAVLGAGMGVMAGGLIGMFSRENLPKIGDVLTIEIFGNRKCSKQEMLDAGIHIIDTQLRRSQSLVQGSNLKGAFITVALQAIIGNALGLLAGPVINSFLTFAGATKISTTFDLVGKHLTMNASWNLGVLDVAMVALADRVINRFPSKAAETFGEGDRFTPPPPAPLLQIGFDLVQLMLKNWLNIALGPMNNNPNDKPVYLSFDFNPDGSIPNPKIATPNPAPPGDGFSRGMIPDLIAVRHPWEDQ